MKIIDDLHAEMTGRGFIYDNRKVVDRETMDTVMAKYGITKKQFNALPNAPDRADYWRGVRVVGKIL